MKMKLSLLKASVLLVLLAIYPASLAHAQHDGTINDKETKLVDFADIEYPTLARTALVQGIVVVRATLDDKGSVVDATAISGSETLIPACIENAKKWRFMPNSKKAVVIVYNFRVTTTVSKSGCSHSSVEAPNLVTVTTCAPEIH